MTQLITEDFCPSSSVAYLDVVTSDSATDRCSECEQSACLGPPPLSRAICSYPSPGPEETCQHRDVSVLTERPTCLCAPSLCNLVHGTDQCSLTGPPQSNRRERSPF
uniref:V-erb-b2 erythroblastic leukemia viral oncogene homolog 2, neuro/glioblastoma derived oncogene homolog n=1 Tax=Nothobranchius furzeri TaxID=105023 RepID=A0A1A8UIH4_NOTFU